MSSWFPEPAVVVGKEYFEEHYKRMKYPFRPSVDAFAEEDLLFHSQMMSDEFLQSVFQKLVDGKISQQELDRKTHLQSAFKSILRGLKTRINFSMDQKVRIVFHFQTLDKADSLERSKVKKLKLVEKIDEYVEETLEMIQKLKPTFGDSLEEDAVLLKRWLKHNPFHFHSKPVAIEHN